MKPVTCNKPCNSTAPLLLTFLKFCQDLSSEPIPFLKGNPITAWALGDYKAFRATNIKVGSTVVNSSIAYIGNHNIISNVIYGNSATKMS